jgi:hypothetical protein
MRIASSPKRRIAAGLLSAVLLSVVGYQVVRRLNPHGPDVLLKRADVSSRLYVTARGALFHLSVEEGFPVVPGDVYAIADSIFINASNSGSVLTVRHEPIIDLPLTPDTDWHASSRTRERSFHSN